MPVAPTNPPGGLVAPTTVAPAAVAPAAVAYPAAVAVGINHGVVGRDQATQRRQLFIAVGNIGGPQVV